MNKYQIVSSTYDMREQEVYVHIIAVFETKEEAEKKLEQLNKEYEKDPTRGGYMNKSYSIQVV